MSRFSNKKLKHFLSSRKKRKSSSFLTSRKKRKPLVRRRIFRRRNRQLTKARVFRTAPPEPFSSTRFSKIIYTSFIIFFVLGLGYFLFFFDFFRIKNVTILGNDYIGTEEIKARVLPILEERRFYFFPGKNIFFVNTKKIKQLLQDQIPLIDQVEINRRYPSLLRFEIKEKEVIGIWQTGEKNYLIDEKGMICDEESLSDASGKNLVKIIDASKRPVSIKEEVTLPRHMNFIRDLRNKFFDQTGLEIDFLVLPQPRSEEIHLKTKKNFIIYFTLARNIDSQLHDLTVVLQQELAEKLDQIEYIDLRVERWVYYK